MTSTYNVATKHPIPNIKKLYFMAEIYLPISSSSQYYPFLNNIQFVLKKSRNNIMFLHQILKYVVNSC